MQTCMLSVVTLLIIALSGLVPQADALHCFQCANCVLPFKPEMEVITTACYTQHYCMVHHYSENGVSRTARGCSQTNECPNNNTYGLNVINRCNFCDQELCNSSVIGTGSLSPLLILLAVLTVLHLAGKPGLVLV